MTVLLEKPSFTGAHGAPFTAQDGWSVLDTPTDAAVFADVGGGKGTGVLFPAGTQSILTASFASTTTERRVIDVCCRLSGTVTWTGTELMQARGSNVARSRISTDAASTPGAPRLVNSATSGVTAGSPFPSGDFRMVLDNNDTALTAYIFPDDVTDTGPVELTRTNAAGLSVDSLRLGWSNTSATVDLLMWWPIVATDLADVGPRDYGLLAPPSGGWALGAIAF